MSYTRNINQLKYIGYTKLDNLYSEGEINDITNYIEAFNIANNSIKTANHLFAIRQLLKVIPGLKKALSNKNLIQLLNLHFESNYFLTKAIYFDKPPNSNWFVPYHQDLSISVTKKADIDGYSNWTTKKDVYGVQPPVNILEDTITIRIHLDDTTKDNGALKVVPKSHSNGVIRKGSKYWNMDKQDICEINKGGVMLMKPLLLHASDRTINNQRRRVLHLEFNSNELPNPIKWYEYEKFIS